MSAPEEITVDLAVIGGGLGGVAAALAAVQRGLRVVITEPCPWLGGQLTSQAVPPDEHTWVEQFGITARYRDLRERIRDYYRRNYPLTPQARAARDLNPGLGMVSRLCHEPRVAAAVIDEMLAPWRAAGRLQVLQPYVPHAADVVDDTVRAVTVRHTTTGAEIRIRASFFADATELGDLLPLTGTEYVTGAESRARTGEPSAPEVADPANVQAITWCFAFDHAPGDHTVARPAGYDYWRAYTPEFWGDGMLSFTAPDPRTLRPVTRTLRVNPPLSESRGQGDQRIEPGDTDLWAFRRVLARANLQPGVLDSDIVLANWPMLDYLDGSVIDAPDADRHLAAARGLSLSYLYWLQTEAPRPDGGQGWPGLRLRGDVVGTADGLAQAPYIRESRRIRAMTTVTEQQISVKARGQAGPAAFAESVGVGMYRIDLHPSTGGDNYIDVECSPFEIPLGALVPARTTNLVAAAKNIGTTHITNGAYRLHPVEWNIGEAAGELAAFCLSESLRPGDVVGHGKAFHRYQQRLHDVGVETSWPEVVGY